MRYSVRILDCIYTVFILSLTTMKSTPPVYIKAYRLTDFLPDFLTVRNNYAYSKNYLAYGVLTVRILQSIFNLFFSLFLAYCYNTKILTNHNIVRYYNTKVKTCLPMMKYPHTLLALIY